MIKYSEKSARALGYLKRTYNDVEIYVEDTSSHNMWFRLVKNIFPEDVKFRSVNMLGGREGVIAACKMDQSNDDRKRIYIIDGDLDFLLGIRKPRLKYLYRLRACCVENILINDKAVIDIAVDCGSPVSDTDIRDLMNYPELIYNHEATLRELFSIYATIQKLQIGLKTTRNSVMNFTIDNGSGPRISEEKIIEKMKSLIRESCRISGVREFRRSRLSIRKRCESLPIHMSVSGKNYILPLIYVQVRRVFGYRGDLNHFKIQLAKNFQPGLEPFLYRRLKELSS